MDFSLLLSSYATVWSNPEVLLMTFIGALGGVLLGAIPGMTATMGVEMCIRDRCIISDFLRILLSVQFI